MSLQTVRFYQFANFRLDISEKVLLRDDKPVPLTPKVFDTLLVFTENPGRLLEKAELISKIWRDHHVEEGNLAYNVKMLRRALGDNANHPLFIETVPRRGYRFIREVQEISVKDEPESLFPSKETSKTSVFRLSKFSLAIPLVLLISSVILASWLWQARSFDSKHEFLSFASSLNSEKITSTGGVYQAALSPDGRFMAYSNEEVSGKQGLWLRNLETAENIQIIPASGEFYYGLEFSPDGNSLYFVRAARNSQSPMSLYRISAFGGIPVKILDDLNGWISVSPDGQKISFVRCEHKNEDWCSLLIANTDGTNEKKLLSRPNPIRIGDNQWSPDGKLIAFAFGQSHNGTNDFNLAEFDLETAAERSIISQKFFNIRYLHWMPDGKELLFTGQEQSSTITKLYRISAQTGEMETLSKDSNNYDLISLNHSADTMTVTQFHSDFRLWISPIENPTTAKNLATAQGGFAFAPSGKIVYASIADGNHNIWVMNAVGSNQHQLTSSKNIDWHPLPSPLERYIFFTSNRSGSNQIWRMNPDGSSQIQITTREGGYPIFVTADERWLYYHSALNRNLWKISLDGGEETLFSPEIMLNPSFSHDGRYVAYFPRRESHQNFISVMSVENGKVQKTFDLPDTKLNPVKIIWANDDKSLFYLAKRESENCVWHQSLNGNPPQVFTCPGNQTITDFAISPDGKNFAYLQGKWMHDAFLIKGLK